MRTSTYIIEVLDMQTVPECINSVNKASNTAFILKSNLVSEPSIALSKIRITLNVIKAVEIRQCRQRLGVDFINV